MDELELINIARQGNKSALNTLFQMHYKTLYGFLIKLTGDTYLSEDLLQETLMKAMMNIESFRGDSKFSSWLIQISLNLYRNNLKKQKRISQDNIDDLYLPGGCMENQVEARLQVEKALKELQSMGYEKRVTFILKHYYGYSLEEISRMMKCAEGTVKSRLHNTIKNLKDVLIGGEE